MMFEGVKKFGTCQKMERKGNYMCWDEKVLWEGKKKWEILVTFLGEK